MTKIFYFHSSRAKQVGLLGEQLEVYKEQNSINVEWNQLGNITDQTLIWYKVK